jgi:hypothetical protein
MLLAASDAGQRASACWQRNSCRVLTVAARFAFARRRRSSKTLTRHATLHARHVAAVKATLAANDRMDDTACALSGVEPTSIAGVIALLTYFAEQPHPSIASPLRPLPPVHAPDTGRP